MGASAKAVDFSSVKDGGGAFNKSRVPSGDYAAIITKVEDAESKKTGAFQYLFTIKLKKYSQYAYPYYCVLQENQLWKLRNLMVAAGHNVPKKRLKLDPNKAVGKLIGVTMEDDEYDGRAQSTIAAVFPVSELDDSELPEDTDTEFDEGTDAKPEVADDEPEVAVEVAADDDAEEAPAPKAKKKDKAKKGKKAKGDDLEKLDISDL